MGENTAGETGYDFFISFAEDAREWVYGVLVPKLGRTGKRFALEAQTLNGQLWLNNLQDNIENSRTILLILSPQYLTSERKDLIKQMALLKVTEQRQWQVIPILLKSVERELVLRLIDGIDLTKGYEHEERLDALLASGAPTPEEQADLAIPPYPGMVTFKEEDASRFFGREDEIDEYVKALRDQHLLVLTGASGCGKSSLARAGIIPNLKAKHQFLVKSFRPSDAGLAVWLAELERLLDINAASAQAFLWQEQAQAHSFLVLIDQFEELFAVEDTERPAFVLSEKASNLLRVLAKLRQKIPEFYLLITVRAEFFPQLALCQTYIDFDKYLQRVNALGRENLSAAITKPALKKGVFIDERLVERLVNDAGDDPGILPFVQETLRDLWDKRYERYIGLEAYERLGGKSGSGLKASIAAKAEAAYKSLTTIDKSHSTEKESITKRIFMRLLQFGEGKPDTRRQQSISALRSDQDTPDVFEETLRHLSSEKYRLLTVNREQDDDDSKVDIVHEALIKAWPRLQDWIKDYKELEEKRRIFDFKLKEWERFGQSEAGLLDQYEINEIKEIFDKKNAVSSIFLFSKLAEDFLEKSIIRINPNWNFKGILVFFLLFVSFLFLIAYLLLLVEDISSYVVKIIAYCIFGVLIFILSYFYYYLRKDEPFFEKKITNRITKNYKFTFTVIVIFFATCFLWSYEAYGLFLKHKKCDYLLSSDSIRKNVILNFSNANADKSYLDYMKSDVEKYSKLFLSIVDDFIFHECQSLFDYQFIVQENDLKDEVSFSILSESKELLLTTNPKSKEEKCYLYLDLGVSLLKIAKETVLFGNSSEIKNKHCSTTINIKEAVIASTVGDNEEAARRMIENIVKEPNNAFLKNQLAVIYLNDETMFLAAYDYAKEAVALDPQPAYINNLAKACRYLHRYDCAEENLKKSLRLDEKNPKTNNQVALLYRDRKSNGDLLKALFYIEKAMLYADCKDYVNVDCYAFKKNRGTMFFELNDLKNALKDFESLNNESSIYQEEVYYYLILLYKKINIEYCVVLDKYFNLPQVSLPEVKYRRQKMEWERHQCS